MKATFDYGDVKLSRLVLTNDKKYFEKLKAQNNVELIYEPNDTKNITEDEPIYLIGIAKE